jgi:hypothetical protein
LQTQHRETRRRSHVSPAAPRLAQPRPRCNATSDAIAIPKPHPQHASYSFVKSHPKHCLNDLLSEPQRKTSRPRRLQLRRHATRPSSPLLIRNLVFLTATSSPLPLPPMSITGQIRGVAAHFLCEGACNAPSQRSAPSHVPVDDAANYMRINAATTIYDLVMQFKIDNSLQSASEAVVAQDPSLKLVPGG